MDGIRRRELRFLLIGFGTGLLFPSAAFFLWRLSELSQTIVVPSTESTVGLSFLLVTYRSLFCETEPSRSKLMRIASTGRAIFAVTMIGPGIIGLLHRDFVPVWNP